MGERGCIGEWSWRVEMPRPIVQIPKGCCQLGRADGNVNCKGTSVDGQGESDKLVPTTVDLDDSGGGEKPRVCLGGTKTQIGEVESHGCQADKSRGWVNESRGQTDASTVLNTHETVAIGDGDGTGTKSDAEGASCDGVGPDGHASRSDASSGHRDVPDICNSTDTTADATESISTCQNVLQMQNLPVNAGRHVQAKPRSRAGMPNMRIDTHGVAIHANTARNTQRHVSTWPTDPKPQDLPTGCTKPCRDGMDGLESCPDTQTACVHVVTTVTSHPILCTPSRIYMQPCSPWTRPDPTRSTSRPFRPLSSPSHALCSICDAYVSTHDALLFLSVSREHR